MLQHSRTAIALMTALAALPPATPAAAQQPIPLDTVHAATGARTMGGAAEATRSLEVLDRQQIAALPARSVNDVIARALGVDLMARSPAQADLSIRGSGFEQVLVMVDGVPVNDDQTGHFHLNLAVPLDAVERIEILRGPASALYGSAAVGGVVNIITAGGAAGASVRAQGGSFGSAAGGADLRVRSGAGALRLSIDYDRSDGHRPGTDFTILQARAGGDAPLAGGVLSASAGWAARDFGAEGFYAPFDSWEETRTASAAVAWRSRQAAADAPGFAVEPRLSVRRHGDDFILDRARPAGYRNVHSNWQAAAELVARWRPAHPRVRVAAGAEAVRSSLESQALGNHDEDRVALFAEAAAGDAAAAIITGGLRLDNHSAFGTRLSPSVGAGFSLAPNLRIRASAGAGFRAPTWTERYYSDAAHQGNPDLDAESFRTAEIGGTVTARATPAVQLQLDAAAFLRNAEGLIDWAVPAHLSAPATWRSRNVDQARFTGLEASLAAMADQGARVALHAAVLSLDASSDPALSSKYALRPVTRNLALDATFPLPARLTASARAATYRRQAGDAWHLLDIRLSRPAGPLHLFLDVTNLTDATATDIMGRPAPGRAVTAGGRFRRH